MIPAPDGIEAYWTVQPSDGSQAYRASATVVAFTEDGKPMILGEFGLIPAAEKSRAVRCQWVAVR